MYSSGPSTDTRRTHWSSRSNVLLALMLLGIVIGGRPALADSMPPPEQEREQIEIDLLTMTIVARTSTMPRRDTLGRAPLRLNSRHQMARRFSRRHNTILGRTW